MIVETSAIVAKGLGVRRGGRWVLRPVSFGLPQGAVGIVGPAGSGTSDLLATLATLRRPHTGRLEVLGHDAGARAGLRLLRSRIGFLPASSPWAASSSVRDFVSYAAYYQRRPPTSVARVLGMLDLDDVAGWPLSSLPPDLRVRAGLAAACVHEPDIAFLDHPLTGLSDTAAAELGALIAAAAPTVVVTSAETGPLTSWCDSVLVLHHCSLTPADRAPVPCPPPGPAALAAERRAVPSGAARGQTPLPCG
ncbi:ATP-binding cassette domain-containing protein [Actinocorallia sp. API 0066]|uniref:ATP-binding cassette domain-containing protein n=1 Tax=Actinocorallia sp. API 0066 TaxID=2896846 RepID=UPI001E5AB59C|nr:ATP-binding cassette domain-containing protein [Actinocorallia sp. API 0066]MCD0451372.1 ATP-binding cassette domain-containing protein [Actinocorallia sp. API 0066]